MNIEETIRFVVARHGGQQYGECPFIVHLLLVARHFNDDIHLKIALLHDLLEDTNVSGYELRAGYGSEIVDAVNALTRKDGDRYIEDYIPRVARNALAVDVKLADLEENLFSARHFYPGRYDDLIGRYETARAILLATRVVETTERE